MRSAWPSATYCDRHSAELPVELAATDMELSLRVPLDATVEDSVNRVGVDLNTASVPLLSRVSGLSGTVAKAVVRWREANGAFKSRDQLMDLAHGRGAAAFDRSIDVQVSRLRRKIEGVGAISELIKTVRSSGYIFTPAVQRT